MNKDELKKTAPATEEERLRTLRSLNCGGARDHLASIIAALGDESWRVRKEAVEIFLSIAEAVVLCGEIVELLHSSENAGLRNAAVDILTRLGEPAVPRLLEELGTQDRDVRKFVMDILGDIRSARAVHRILAELGDSDPNVRNAAAENLGKIGSAEAVTPLLESMKTADLYFRFTILEALGRIGVAVPEEALIVFADEKLLKKAIFDCLGRVGGEAGVDFLLDGVLEPSKNARDSAVLALARIAYRLPQAVARGIARRASPEFSAALSKVLKQADGEALEAGIRLAGLSADATFAQDLLELCQREEVRSSAVTALDQLGPGATALLRDLWQQAGGRTRVFLAYIWGEIRSENTEDLLLQALDSSDDELKAIAARSLGRVGSGQAIGPLLACLGEDGEEVRQAAMLSLAELGSRHQGSLLDRIRPLLDSENAALRYQAVTILARVGGDSVETALAFALKDDSAEVRQAAISGLGAGCCRQISAVTMALADEDAQVRRLAAEALGASGSPEALEPLALALNDEDIWVRAAAVKSLGCLGGEQAFLLLEASVLDPVGLVALSALEAAEGFDAQKREVLIRKGLDHEDSEVVLVALRQLAASPQTEGDEEMLERLLGHIHWEVRLNAARAIGARRTGPGCKCLEDRLLVESDELVRSEIREILAGLEPGVQSGVGR